MANYGKTDNYIIQELGGRIKSLRKEKGLSQTALMELTGLNRISISKMENGENFTIHSLIKVMRALNCLDDIDLLFAKKDNDLHKLFE
ncbi:MAG: helix-turn-helix transcriptional regulator [Chitinophagales bacterium]